VSFTISAVTWLTVTGYLCNRLPQICSACRNHNAPMIQMKEMLEDILLQRITCQKIDSIWWRIYTDYALPILPFITHVISIMILSSTKPDKLFQTLNVNFQVWYRYVSDSTHFLIFIGIQLILFYQSLPVVCPWSLVHSGYCGFFHH
jgi:hypothetical protein